MTNYMFSFVLFILMLIHLVRMVFFSKQQHDRHNYALQGLVPACC